MPPPEMASPTAFHRCSESHSDAPFGSFSAELRSVFTISSRQIFFRRREICTRSGRSGIPSAESVTSDITSLPYTRRFRTVPLNLTASKREHHDRIADVFLLRSWWKRLIPFRRSDGGNIPCKSSAGPPVGFSRRTYFRAFVLCEKQFDC